MKSITGLRAFALIALLLGAALLIIAVLVQTDNAALIIPPPEGTAEQLIGALAAHRYEGAMNQLSQDIQQQVSEKDLQAIVKSIEESPRKGIQDAHGQDAQTQGAQGTASVEVKFGDNQTQTIDLPLVKENGLWKVASLGPVQALGQSSQ